MDRGQYASQIAEDAYSSNMLDTEGERAQLEDAIHTTLREHPRWWDGIQTGGDCAYSPADAELAEEIFTAAWATAGFPEI